jgi:hypothetical protein
MVAEMIVIISQQQFVQITCALIIFTTIFVLARAIVQLFKRRTMEVQDYIIYAAYMLFLVMTICYLIMAPKIYKIADLTNGLIPPWEGVQDDIIFYMRMMLVTTSLFWIALWSVKLSLLALYKKLMIGLPLIYIRLWWAVLSFCLVVGNLLVSRYSFAYKSPVVGRMSSLICYGLS